MSEQTFIQREGGQASNKQPRKVPLDIIQIFTGLVTNRNALIEPGPRADKRFYGGHPDALFNGLNTEVSSQGTIIRRPGWSTWSTQSFAAAPNDFYSFRDLAGNVNVFADVTVANGSGNVDKVTTTTSTSIWAKSVGAGRTFFQSVGSKLFFTNAVENKMWISGTTTNMGIVPPNTPPSVAYGVGSGNTYQPTGWIYGYTYRSATSTSTMSPISVASGPKTAFSSALSNIEYSTDTQVTNIDIYRTSDGGAFYLYLATIANNSAGGVTSYTDTGAADSTLDAFQVAPQALANNPPPVGLQNLCFYAGRLWGSVGNILYYAGGPDTTNGDGQQCWPPANYFQFSSPITCLIATSSGVIVFTTSDVQMIAGTCSIYGSGTLFYPVQLFAGIGVGNYDAVDNHTSNIFFFTTDRRLLMISPTAGLADIGNNIADQFASFDPAKVKVVCHSSGYQDNSVVFISDGVGSWFRLNPSQIPESTTCWSPMGTLAAGLVGMQSCETSAGVHQLLGGSGTSIVFRDFTTYSDQGTPYAASATFGPLFAAHSGQMARMDFITSKCKAVGSVMTPAVLFDEISGTFNSMTQFSQDPTKLVPSTSVYSNRWYINQTTNPFKCQFIQMKVTWPSEAYANELLQIGLYGAIEVE